MMESSGMLRYNYGVWRHNYGVLRHIAGAMREYSRTMWRVIGAIAAKFEFVSFIA